MLQSSQRSKVASKAVCHHSMAFSLRQQLAPARLSRPQALTWAYCYPPRDQQLPDSHESPGEAGLPAACWFPTFCRSLSAPWPGREGGGTAAASSRAQHLHDILSRCTAHPALSVKPSPPVSAQGWGRQSLSMHRQMFAIRSLWNPRKEWGKKGGENTPTLVTSIKFFFHFYLLGTVKVCFHL